MFEFVYIFVMLFVSYKLYQRHKLISEIPRFVREGVLFVDVRTPAEFARRHHEKTINIPLNEIEQRINEFPMNTHIVLICSSGTRSMMAKKKLEKYGHKKTYNLGGWRNMKRALKNVDF